MRLRVPISLLLVLALLGGCTGASEPEPAGEPEQPPVQSPVQSLVREEIPGGFRLGPLDPRSDFHWVGSEQVWFGGLTQAGDPVRGTVSLTDGEVVPDTELDALHEPWHYLRSPDGLRAVGYSSKGAHPRFINRETGTAAELGLPDSYVGSLLDSWAPDSRHFLVQSIRTDAVPGFYFLDHEGSVTGTFAEPGYFSHRGVWSPDGRKVAFLSVPLDVTYPRSPEEWEEPPFGERVGILDLETGEVEYLALDGYSFFGFPVWSEDGSELAAFCGELETFRVASPSREYESTRLRDPRICVLDPASSTVMPVGDPLPGEPMLRITGIAPDAVLVGYWVDSGQRYGWVPRGGGPLLPLPGGEPVLVTGGLAAVVTGAAPDRLVLVNPQGEEVRTLAEGDIRSLTVSPDRTHVAFMHNGYLTVLAVGPDSAAHGTSAAQD